MFVGTRVDVGLSLLSSFFRVKGESKVVRSSGAERASSWIENLTEKDGLLRKH